jgi:rhodanese-related sulfurtransferase
MIAFIKRIFGFGPTVDFKALVSSGALIIDVRSPAEFAGGHVNKAQNIPLDRLSSQLKKLPKEKPIITCCASGMRSASAKALLQSNGFQEVYNGGGWQQLQHKLN